MNWPIALALQVVLMSAALAQVPAEDLQSLVAAARQRHRLPSLAVAVVEGPHLSTARGGCASDDPVFPIGSLSKSITAAVAVRLWEKGRLDLQRPLGELLPELPMHRHYQRVTLEQLLCHQAGLPANFPQLPLHPALELDEDPPPDLKRLCLEQILLTSPEGQPFLYSNLGYVLAARVMERLSDLPWPQLVEREVFQPLGLQHAGLGYRPGPGDPLPHRWLGGEAVGFSDLARRGNPRVLDGADQVRCSLSDLARYAQAHLQRDPKWLSAEGYRKLHKDRGHSYALGWGVQRSPWSRGPLLSHHGSNTYYYATCMLAPQRQLAVVCLTDVGWDEQRSNERTRLALVEVQEQVRRLALGDSL